MKQKIRPLRTLTPIRFESDENSPLNGYNSLPQLLRSVADYLDDHPEYNSTCFFDLTIHHESEGADDSYFSATLYAHEDDSLYVKPAQPSTKTSVEDGAAQ